MCISKRNPSGTTFRTPNHRVLPKRVVSTLSRQVNDRDMLQYYHIIAFSTQTVISFMIREVVNRGRQMSNHTRNDAEYWFYWTTWCTFVFVIKTSERHDLDHGSDPLLIRIEPIISTLPRYLSGSSWTESLKLVIAYSMELPALNGCQRKSNPCLHIFDRPGSCRIRKRNINRVSKEKKKDKRESTTTVHTEEWRD